MTNRIGNWNLRSGGGSIALSHDGGTSVAFGRSALLPVATAEPHAASYQSIHGHRLESATGDLLFRAVLAQGPTADWLSISVSVTNRGSAPISVDSVAVVDTAVIQTPVSMTRHLISGEAMIDYSAMVAVGERPQSINVTGWSNDEGTHAIVAGFEQLDSCLCRLNARETGGRVDLTAICVREGVPLAPGQTLNLPPLLIGAGASLMELMDAYARRTGERHGARHVPIRTGWCSWYDYYSTETEDDILLNAETIAKSPLNEHVHVIQIDDGWNLPTAKHARVWGDWTPGAKFPHGMKHTADRIHALGQQAGLWLAPFAVDPASNLFREHPEWLIKDETGAPKSWWGVYGLDLTQAAVLEYIRTTFDRVFNEWGYDYIKIDFLIYAVIPGGRADRNKTSVEAFREAMAVIRSVAGERFVLNCGSPVGPSIGLCDGMRLGPDVSARWFIPLNVPDWPIGNCCIKAAAIHAIWRHWMHRTWWQNDPDCLQVREDGSPAEKEMFGREFDRKYATEPPFGLSLEEAGFWLRFVWLSGGMSLISENMTRLTEERSALLARAYPLNSQPTRIVDWYTDLDVVAMKTTQGPLKVGVFNLSDSRRTAAIPAARFGLGAGSHRWRERISGETCTTSGSSIVFPDLPAHSGRIWELQG